MVSAPTGGTSKMMSFIVTVAESIPSNPILGLVSMIACVCSLFIIPDCVLSWKKRRGVGKIPYILQESFFGPWLEWINPDRDFDGEIARAYQKYTKKGKPFAIPNLNGSGSFIVLPPQSCDEWANLPRERLSWTALMTGEFLLHDINFDMTWQIASQAVLACNRSGVIKQVEHRIIQEVDGYLIRMFPSQVENDWREIKVTDMVIELASSLALLVVFNDGIGKDPRLLQHLMSYSENLEGRVGTQMKYPFLLRPFVRRFSHSTRTLNSSIAALKGILVPEIRRRMEKIDQKQTSTTAGSEIFYLDSMIHLAYKKNIINSYSGEKEKNKLADLISEHTLMICFEFSGPIWMFAAIMLFEVMLRPKYVTPLREELEAAVELSKGEWSFDTFKHTPKLESFTRETLRVNPPSTLTSGRLVIEPLHLPSLGLTLEPGSKIALPSRWAMLDPDIYPDPHTFDGYRFIDPASGICDIRDTTTPSKTWLPFAIGTLTCPGRLIGLRVCQTILSKMLMDYDMELVNHDNHPLMLHGLGVAVPNPEIKMRVKSRHTGREKVQSAS